MQKCAHCLDLCDDCYVRGGRTRAECESPSANIRNSWGINDKNGNLPGTRFVEEISLPHVEIIGGIVRLVKF